MHLRKRRIAAISSLVIIIRFPALFMIYQSAVTMHVQQGHTEVSPLHRLTEAAARFNDDAIPITIVTAYFDLGTFKKGSGKFTTRMYLDWAKTFEYLNNSLVIYTDSRVLADYMRSLRVGKEAQTKIVLISRKSLWTFQIQNKTRTVFSQKGFPRHFPNTVVPAYSCAQHSKYAVVADAVRNAYFNTHYYAWLDIGYFRDIIKSKKGFSLNIPNNFEKDKLAINLVYTEQSLNLTYKTIVYNNIVWVGGGMFIGTPNVLLEFEAQYRNAVMFLLGQKLMSTDQQVILSMYSSQGQKDMKPTVQLQLYSRGRHDHNVINNNPGFYLGYRCLKFTHPK